ncbi:hypothetical protein ACHWQZ_G008940 [Mnemiopsis leidyi]
MRKNKDSAWNDFSQSPTRENYSYAFMKDKLYSDEEFRLKSNYEKKLTNNLKTNPKGFYSYLRNKRQLKTGVPTLERSDGSRTSGPAESAEALAEAFSSVFVHEPENLPSVEKPEVEPDILCDIDITFDKVKQQLEGLNCFKSYGPDGVHPKLLKSLADDSSFVEAVVKLFRKCTDSGELPKIWKSASLTALFKNGSKTDPLNYRPVSLTCIMCKVYEKILRDEILEFVDDKINPHQHGNFLKAKEDKNLCTSVLGIPAKDIKVCWRAGKADESNPNYRRPLVIRLKDEELVKEWTKDGRGHWINRDLCAADRKANFLSREERRKIQQEKN